MARMHIRRKGKSHSKRPPSLKRPDWLKYSPEEIGEIVVKLAREGRYPSEIGRILRDEYGVPTFRQVMGKRLAKYLEEKGIKYDYPEDLAKLLEKARRMINHLRTHRKDRKNKHSLELIEAKIHNLSVYYKKIGKLPKEWRYKTAVARIE
jgi:small subunit ribosomal protein S15